MKKVRTKINKLVQEYGFTLIEMLIVLFVIGALLLIAIPNLTGAGVDAQQKACDANKKLIITQAESYYLENGNVYPGEVQDLITKNYLRGELLCPSIHEGYEGDKEYLINVIGTGQNADIKILCPVHDKND